MGEAPGQYLKKGAEVEISSDKEGFCGTWYAGTVIRPMSKKNLTIMVVYKSLMADEEGSELLQELVDLVQLRPPPLRELGRGFNFSEEVDAFHNDGWWEGVVTEVLDGGRCSIFFRGLREQMDFATTNLRLHREWVTSKWVLPLEEENVLIESSDLDKIRPDYGANLVICTQDELFSICIPFQEIGGAKEGGEVGGSAKVYGGCDRGRWVEADLGKTKVSMMSSTFFGSMGSEIHGNPLTVLFPSGGAGLEIEFRDNTANAGGSSSEGVAHEGGSDSIVAFWDFAQ
ncbi:protein AGENET DOMAIN (AGD)-CONTAINING P1-like [Malania oleifera]|uniref:protein AGENET DOMAIN (AGD)-CONTAINING P1-like n=1 Tax=Malania oleifera TaxID=397392 RepID=UPI0025AE4849|nr:protein AGENET DOMAIN (AGD)-CONTAINING P1-like [Malania oleifera]